MYFKCKWSRRHIVMVCVIDKYVTGVACRLGTLTPPDTWSRPFGTCICSTCWDQSFSELVVILPDYALRISLGTFSILLTYMYVTYMYIYVSYMSGTYIAIYVKYMYKQHHTITDLRYECEYFNMCNTHQWFILCVLLRCPCTQGNATNKIMYTVYTCMYTTHVINSNRENSEILKRFIDKPVDIKIKIIFKI